MKKLTNDQIARWMTVQAHFDMIKHSPQLTWSDSMIVVSVGKCEFVNCRTMIRYIVLDTKTLKQFEALAPIASDTAWYTTELMKQNN